MATRRSVESPQSTEARPQAGSSKSTRAVRAKPAARAPVSVDDRRAMIAEAAYLRAERRGFAPGQENEDWLAAEQEVDALLQIGPGGPRQ
jgi:hypothetical protein